MITVELIEHGQQRGLFGDGSDGAAEQAARLLAPDVTTAGAVALAEALLGPGRKDTGRAVRLSEGRRGAAPRTASQQAELLLS